MAPSAKEGSEMKPYCTTCNDTCIDQNDPTGQADCGSCGGSFAWRQRAKYYASALPKREGQEITFDAHGQQWRIKRLGRDTWTLYNVRATAPRCRFGNREEIANDLATVVQTGILPGKAGRP